MPDQPVTWNKHYDTMSIALAREAHRVGKVMKWTQTAEAPPRVQQVKRRDQNMYVLQVGKDLPDIQIEGTFISLLRDGEIIWTPTIIIHAWDYIAGEIHITAMMFSEEHVPRVGDGVLFMLRHPYV